MTINILQVLKVFLLLFTGLFFAAIWIEHRLFSAYLKMAVQTLNI